MDLAPWTAAEEGTARARPGDPSADDWQTMQWVATNIGDANATLQDGAPYLHNWALAAGDLAEQERKAARAGATKEWRQWAYAHSTGGPRRPPRCGDPQLAADKVMESWGVDVWRMPAGQHAPWQERPPPEEPKLAPLVPAEVHQHCMGLKEQAGGAEGIERIFSVFDAVEDGEPWPSSQSDILFYHTPKAEGGGMRCLGILPEVVRRWEKCRRPIIAKWEACHRRDYDWSRAGRSSERSARMQQLFREAAVVDNESRVITLLDLVTCFEYVGHWKVWEPGLHWGFPKRLLRVVLRIYAMTRRVVLEGAGYHPMDNRLAEMCLFFGDLSIAHMSERTWVAAGHARMVRLVIDRLENELEMPASLGEKGKTALLASSTALSKDLEPMTRKIGIKTVSQAKHLDVTVYA
ncbi:unnamed protein product, partial [Prorocentrum cordatum]